MCLPSFQSEADRYVQLAKKYGTAAHDAAHDAVDGSEAIVDAVTDAVGEAAKVVSNEVAGRFD